MSKPTYKEIAAVIKNNPVRVQRTIDSAHAGKGICFNRYCPYSPLDARGETTHCGSWCAKFEGQIIPVPGHIECWCHYHETAYLLCELFPGGE